MQSRSCSRSSTCKRHNIEVQGDIDNYVVKTSATFKSGMDIKIVKLFYACNLPFNIVDHDHFVKVVKVLRPGYLPNRKAITG